IAFSRRYPQSIVCFDGDLSCHILASETFVRRQPGRGVAVPLLRVSRPIDGEKVQRVVRERSTLLIRDLLGTFLPCVRQSDDVINLYVARCRRATVETDRRARERIVEGS